MVFTADMKCLVRKLIHAKDTLAETSRSSCHIKGTNDSSADTALVCTPESCDDVRHLAPLSIGRRSERDESVLSCDFLLDNDSIPNCKNIFLTGFVMFIDQDPTTKPQLNPRSFSQSVFRFNTDRKDGEARSDLLTVFENDDFSLVFKSSRRLRSDNANTVFNQFCLDKGRHFLI